MDQSNHDAAGRSDALSLLNVLAAFSVVAIHVNSCYFTFSATERYWKTAVVMHFAEYFGVDSSAFYDARLETILEKHLGTKLEF